MQEVSLTRIDSVRIRRDYQHTAKVASLVYVNDRMPGINRKRKGLGFTFIFRDKLVSNRETLAWIKNWPSLLPGQMSGSVLKKTDTFRQRE